MNPNNRANKQDRDRKMIMAIQKYLMKETAILIAGVTYTPDQIVALLQQEVAAADAATQAKATLSVAAAAVAAEAVKLAPFLVGFRSFLQNMFTDPSTIAEFGFAPRKVGQVNAAAKALAVDKRLATRAARHTMGKVQKKEVKGTVAPAAAPPTPTAGSSPTAGTPAVTPSPVVASAPATGTSVAAETVLRT